MKTVASILLCLALTACGNDPDNSGRDEEKVFDPLIESVDKAQAVEDTVLQQKQDMDDAVQRMEEGAGDKDV
ncbi:MAG: hypothetical protein RLN69_07295 [Woeseiaceae bacterium]